MAKRMKEKTAKIQENKDTRPYAIARYVRMGSSKAKRVLDTIRGKEYNVAKAILVNNTSLSAAPILKVLNSAAANAEHNNGLNKEDLYVAECFADQGPSFKRVSFRGRGGVDTIIKRTCHITIILDVVKK